MDRLNALEAFAIVLETGSFSAAARRLGLGQPAVSKLVAQLEQKLGQRLLLRSTRGLSATEAGQRYFESIQPLLDGLREAELALRGESGSLTGRLRVSAALTYGRMHLMPRLPEFLAAHPQLEVDVLLDDRHLDLIEEGVDLSLRMGELADSSLTARKLASARRVVVGTPRYFGRAGRPKKPCDLLQHEMPMYLQFGSAAQAWTFAQGDVRETVKVKGRVRVSAAEGLRSLVLADYGVAVASEWMFSEELASGQVVEVLRDWTLPTLDLWAVFPSGRLVSAKARAFADFVAGGPPRLEAQDEALRPGVGVP